jgi:hypothetical protein
MVNILAKVISLMVFCGAAAVAAFLLGYVAHDEFGISPHAIRIAATLAGGLLVIAMYGERMGKPK